MGINRTAAATIGLTMGRTLGAALLLASPLLAIHTAPAATPHVEAGAGKAVNVPTWTAQTAAHFPGCSTRKVLGDVVFVGQDGKARRIDFDTAWKAAHDASKADDGWVVGFCK